MAGLADVLARVQDDLAFREQLLHDPLKALAGYELTSADLRALAASLADATGPPARTIADLFDLSGRDQGDVPRDE